MHINLLLYRYEVLILEIHVKVGLLALSTYILRTIQKFNILLLGTIT